MADKGIIFAAPMVRALIDGRKTQTRRLLNPAPATFEVDGAECEVGLWHEPGKRSRVYVGRCITSQTVPYAPGDRLYVREAWAIKRFEPCLPHERDWQSLHGPTVRYLADGTEIEHRGDRSTGRGIYHGPVEKGRPSIHMPRWASRMWLAVTEVRVQRLQDISEADAIAEGLICRPMEGPGGLSIDIWHWLAGQDDEDCFTSAVAAYRALWDSLHTEPGTRWAYNPWIVAVTFDVNCGNIDA